MIYAVLAFIGFEASGPLAEEASDPQRTIPRAVLLSCLLIGLFYLLTYYAATVYFGPAQMADPKAGFFVFNNGDPWTGLATKVWGIGWILVFLAVANSAIANSNAGANAATRVGYALSRIGILPHALSAIHPEHRTPHIAVHVQAVVGIVLAVALGLATGSPLNAFALLGTVATIIIVAIYILTNLSCLIYYWRERRDEFNPLLHGVVPIVGSLIFAPALVASFGIDFGGLGISALTSPANLAPPIIGVWMILGLAVLAYLWSTDRRRIDQTAALFLEGEAAEA